MSELTDEVFSAVRYHWKPKYGNYDEMIEFARRVAERAEAELQLTEELGYQIDGDRQAEPDAWFPAADLGSIRRVVTHRRWVTAWSEVIDAQS
jgi:hypothetical protein